MEELIQYLNKVTRGLNDLKHDVAKIIIKTKNEDDTKKGIKSPNDKKAISLKSFQPMTRIRASKEDAVNASKNKDTTFIVDTLEDIFGD